MSTFQGDYAGIYDLIHEGKPYAEEAELIYSKCKSPSSILDVACGTGRHLLEFSKFTKDVIGNDLSESMLNVAKSRLEQADLSMALLQGPMQNISERIGGKTVDLVTANYTSFGYLVEPNDVLSFFESLKKTLKVGGYYFADYWNSHRMENDYSPSREKEFENESLKIHRKSNVKCVKHLSALNVEFLLNVENKKTGLSQEQSESHLVRYHSPAEISALLTCMGFEVVEMAPHFDESEDLTQCWNFYSVAKRIF